MKKILLPLILSLVALSTSVADDRSPEQIIMDAGGNVIDVPTLGNQTLLTIVTNSVLNQQTQSSGVESIMQGLNSNILTQLQGIFKSFGTVVGFSPTGSSNPLFSSYGSLQALTAQAMQAAQQQAQSLNYDPNYLNSIQQLNDQVTRTQLFDQKVRALEQTSSGPLTIGARYAIANQIKALNSEQLNQAALDQSLNQQNEALYEQQKLQDTQREISQQRGTQMIESGDY